MNQELWDKILTFDFDYPVSEYGFTTRIANENFWTKTFTEAAVLEYKKFMYLAATADGMVSPSEIVDAVWHQHLIFSKSYADFCILINRQVQHIPSTHNVEEYEKFKQAKERTKKLYNSIFGEQPKAIWEYSDMYASLELPKGRIKIRSFILVGVLLFASLLIPFYFILKPVYIHIGNPQFIYGFISISILTFYLLDIYNRNYSSWTFEKFNKFTFIRNLTPFELVYLKTKKLSNVIHGTINQLVKENVIKVNEDHTIELTSSLKAECIENHQVLETLHDLGRTDYMILLRQLLLKPVFKNVATCMDSFKKYYLKSKSFGKLFYINFAILAFLLLLGLIRIFTGLSRDKPIIIILIITILLTVIIIAYLWWLTNLFCTITIPKFYRRKFIVDLQTEISWQWQYFLFGNAALALSFGPLINHVEKGNSVSAESNTTDTSTCGSSCGSSCSSCGGCGGGD